jgi:hypothetical protein
MTGVPGVLMLLAVSGVIGLELQTPVPVREAGYVVEATEGAWEAEQLSGAVRPLVRGTGVWPGDVVRLRGGGPASAEPRISVLLFSTGRIVRLSPGSNVDASVPPRSGTLQRLLDAMRQRLAGETLVPGTVRSGGLIEDAVIVDKAGVHWKRIAPGLAAGPYTGRFRPLGADGRPAGAWTRLETFQVTRTGHDPAAASGTLGPGLWQVAISHQQVPSIAGDGWLLIARDADASAVFEALNSALAASVKVEGLQIQSAVLRARRAAMLALSAGLRAP